MQRYRLILLAGLGSAAVLLLVYGLVLFPRQTAGQRGLSDDIRTLSALNEAGRIRLIQTERAIRELLGERVPVYPRAESAPDERSGELLRKIGEAVQRTHVSLQKLEPGPPEESPMRMSYPFVMDFGGSYLQVCTLMQLLEEGLRLVPVQWNMELDPNRKGRLRVTAKWVAYEWSGKALNLPLRLPGEPHVSVAAHGEDPFGGPPPRASAVEPSEEVAAVDLDGVLDIGGKSMAIIEGRAYRVGDRVEGRRILSISGDAVVLEGLARPLRIESGAVTAGP